MIILTSILIIVLVLLLLMKKQNLKKIDTSLIDYEIFELKEDIISKQLGIIWLERKLETTNDKNKIENLIFNEEKELNIMIEKLKALYKQKKLLLNNKKEINLLKHLIDY